MFNRKACFSDLLSSLLGLWLRSSVIFFQSAFSSVQLLRRVRLFVTPWTVVHQAPLSMGTLQARILEWVAMLSSRSGHHGERQNVVPGSGRAWDCQPTPLGTPVRLVPAVCSPSAPPPLAFQCPECAGGGTRASPAVWEDGDCIPPCPHSPTTPGVARDLPWGLVNHWV